MKFLPVFLILGILAAVATSKYLDVTEAGRKVAAQGAIAEVKGRLSAVQTKYMMNNSGTPPTSPVLLSYATTGSSNGYGSGTNLANVGTDFTVVTATGTPNITIIVSVVGGVTLGTSVLGTFAGVGDL